MKKKNENKEKYEPGKHPNSLANLIPISKGVSGNPNGRPKKTYKRKILKNTSNLGKHPNSLANLTPFPKGVSGNPNGTTKRPSWDDCYITSIKKRKRIKNSDPYIIRRLTTNTNLKKEDIPEELIKAKKEQLQLKRILKENGYCKENNSKYKQGKHPNTLANLKPQKKYQWAKGVSGNPNGRPKKTIKTQEKTNEENKRF